ncbi:hypothetical protein [Methanoregula formicica]|uniref:hypothetical protein n=1 Tax=Methanoregula formicica TaxID=882104 RepID=UPI0011D29D52|nr:hypothetical protein [Methanoregula formicica]
MGIFLEFPGEYLKDKIKPLHEYKNKLDTPVCLQDAFFQVVIGKKRSPDYRDLVRAPMINPQSPNKHYYHGYHQGQDGQHRESPGRDNRVQ